MTNYLALWLFAQYNEGLYGESIYGDGTGGLENTGTAIVLGVSVGLIILAVVLFVNIRSRRRKPKK
ncbi:MAG TPA: hypothetical protein VGA08_01285 [Candidatus Saccharimonadales bacterium]